MQLKVEPNIYGWTRRQKPFTLEIIIIEENIVEKFSEK